MGRLHWLWITAMVFLAACSTVPVKKHKLAPVSDFSHPLMKPKKEVIAKLPQKPTHAPLAAVHHWGWPLHGAIITKFSERNKGINISGHPGDVVLASAAGKVVYSGNGLRDYGNLIIIKHNNLFLTAYAHSSAVAVKEGDWVKPGQKIAELGKAGSKRVMLHFEIRKDGKPVNPMEYLKLKG